MSRRRAHVLPAAALAAALAVAACDPGNGSDIGPELPDIPDVSCKVVVLDDQGRGVVGATVTTNGGARAITGRNGRGDFLAEPRGRVVFAVDVAAAAARSGDELANVRVALQVPGPDVPQVLHVPDLRGGTPATLALGVQTSAATIRSAAGADVTVPAGATVLAASAGGATVRVAAGDLAARHLPGELPASPSGAWLFSAGVCVDPPDVVFTPPADLTLTGEAGLGTGPARLFRLDPVSGEWGEVVVTANANGGVVTAAAAVATGGIYAFAVPVAAATVVGRIVDAAPFPATVPAPVPDVMLRVDHVPAWTGRDGRFVATGVPAELADGTTRDLVLEMFAGGSWLPVRNGALVAVAGPVVDTGDLTLDTLPAGNVRVQQVLQGRAETFRPARLSSLRGDVALVTTGDGIGQAFFEDVPGDYFGFQDGRALDAREVVYGQSIGFLERGRRWLDSYQFFITRAWFEGGRRTRTYVSDALGGGPLEQAFVVQGTVAGSGLADRTREGGTVFVTRDFAGRATAARRSQRDGRELVHAVSIVVPNGEHLELPLQRVLRTPIGAFDRHGLVGGDVQGSMPSEQHELRVTRILRAQQWWDELVDGVAAPAAVPVDVDPATSPGAWLAGVPLPAGNVVIAATVDAGSLKTLQRAAIVPDIVPVEGQRLELDVELDAVASSVFVVPDALAGAPAELDVGRLSVAVALQQPNGRIVEVARDLRGNHGVSGDALTFALPPLTGPRAGHGWLVLLGGSYVSNGSTVQSSTLLSLPAGTAPLALPGGPTGPVRFGGFPEITAPANGATVPAAGFTVGLALPPDAVFGTIELRSTTSDETLLWQVYVPPTLTSLPFVALPAEVPSPLLPGRTFTLTVSAYFGNGVVASTSDPYRDTVTFLQSIGAVERGTTQVQRRSITLTTN